MNILRILTLNKHGDFEEVLFSSALSYLLNPQQNHGLGSEVLEKIAREWFPDIDQQSFDSAIVESERTLGKMGAIDLLITMGDKILAIEVKIWDRSARNVSKDNKRQIERYCEHLSEEFKEKDWRFIFLIPTMASRICIEEFKNVCDGDYKDHVKLMTWVSGDPLDDAKDLDESYIIRKSIADIFMELDKDVKRVDLPLNTIWLMDSLTEIIPDLVEDVPDRGRFPYRGLLAKQATWPIFKAFLEVNNRWPSSLTTTVGFPYGRGVDRADLHKNSLYRIRTVTAYYTALDQQEAYLPVDKVELELWPDVYALCKESIKDWLKELGLDESVIRNEYHLDGGSTDTVVVSIDKDIVVDEDSVNRLNYILKEGFRKVIQAESK